jgi:membrane-bound ClpP family serine protease
MLILGLVLLIVGLLFPQFAVLETIGIVLLIIGAVLWAAGYAGHPVGGRRFWW